MQLTIFFSFSWPPKSFFRKSFTLIFIVVNYIWLICFWVEISVAADVSTFFLFCPPLPPPDCLLPIKKASRQQGTRGSRYHPNWFIKNPLIQGTRWFYTFIPASLYRRKLRYTYYPLGEFSILLQGELQKTPSYRLSLSRLALNPKVNLLSPVIALAL